jgi:hypothetical protein
VALLGAGATTPALKQVDVLGEVEAVHVVELHETHGVQIAGRPNGSCDAADGSLSSKVQLEALDHGRLPGAPALDQRSAAGQVHRANAMSHPVLVGDYGKVSSHAGTSAPLDAS